jgi:hypothetical protein
LVNLLTGPINISPIFKDNGDLRESITGYGTGKLQIRNASHGIFNGIGNPLFDFKRSKTLGLSINLDLGIGNIGYSINREFLIAIHPDRNPGTDKEQHPNRILYGKLNDSFE